MAVAEVVFSPTGGTKKVADTVAARLAEQESLATRVVDLSDPDFGTNAVELAPDDMAVIAVPSFGGRVPALAVERLARVKSNGAASVLVCVYGNRAFEDTLVELEDAAQAADFAVVAAVAAVAEHSIVRSIAAGRPDEADRKELASFADRISERVRARAAGETLEPPTIPGNRPYKKAGGAGMVPKAGKASTRGAAWGAAKRTSAGFARARRLDRGSRSSAARFATRIPLLSVGCGRASAAHKRRSTGRSDEKAQTRRDSVARMLGFRP